MQRSLLFVAVFALLMSSCVPLPIPYRNHNIRVSGVVVDSATQLPVGGVRIELHDPERNEYGESVTDDDGEFYVKTPGVWSPVFWFPLLPFDPLFVERPFGLNVEAERYCGSSQNYSAREAQTFVGGAYVGHAHDLVIALRKCGF
jgi:hypothetical protein